MSRPTTPIPPPGRAASQSGISGASSKSPSEQMISPPRSSTFHHSKPKRSHIPQLPHRTHRHHADDRNVPQSAVVGPSHNPFGDFLTKTKSSLVDPFPTSSSALVGLGGTRTPPRLETPETARDILDREKQAKLREQEAEEQRQKEEENRLKWKEAQALKAKRIEADEELRNTLSQLSNLSSLTTRRLDNTYYSLLSSLSALRSGVESLHRLSKATHQLGERFASETDEVITETTAVVQRVEDQIQRQAERIEGLEARLQAGKEKVGGLGERLDAVREKIEAAAEKDGEGRRRVKDIWRMCAGCLTALMILMIGIGLWQKGGADGIVALGGENGGDSFWQLEMREGTLGAEDLKRGLEGLRGPDLVNESSSDDIEAVEDPKEEQSIRSTKAEATLKLFDEL